MPSGTISSKPKIITGKSNLPNKYIDYKGIESDTASITVDQREKTIKADVKVDEVTKDCAPKEYVDTKLLEKADKIGPLPEYVVSANDNILDFIDTNNIDSSMSIILNIEGDIFIGNLYHFITYYEGIRIYLKSLNHNYFYNIEYTTNFDEKRFGNIIYDQSKKYSETTNNKVTTLSSESTDDEYPSAKCVYDSYYTKSEVDGIVSNMGIDYVTTAPTADNTNGIKIALLSEEPTTKYNGWLYIIQ